MKISQNDYLRVCAIAMAAAILLLTIFVSVWCFVSAFFAVLILAITDYLTKDAFSNEFEKATRNINANN